MNDKHQVGVLMDEMKVVDERKLALELINASGD